MAWWGVAAACVRCSTPAVFFSVGAVSEITQRLFSSIVLPMHPPATPLGEFTAAMGETFHVDIRDEPSFAASLRDLPRRPTILVLKGV